MLLLLGTSVFHKLFLQRSSSAQGLAAKEINPKADAVSGVCDQEIQRLLSDPKAHEGAASMVLAFLCEAVLAGKVAVMGNMKAECLSRPSDVS